MLIKIILIIKKYNKKVDAGIWVYFNTVLNIYKITPSLYSLLVGNGVSVCMEGNSWLFLTEIHVMDE